MDIIQISSILTQLVARYPGGLRAFKNEGGSISAIPSPSNDLVITHPNLPEDIQAAFKQMAEQNVGQQAPYPVLQKVPNFWNIEAYQRRGILSKLAVDLAEVDESITIGETPGVLILTIPKIRQTNPKAESIRAIVDKIPDITLVYLLWKGHQPEAIKKGDSWYEEVTAASEMRPHTIDDHRQVQAEIDQLLKEIGGISGPNESI